MLAKDNAAKEANEEKNRELEANLAREKAEAEEEKIRVIEE